MLKYSAENKSALKQIGNENDLLMPPQEIYPKKIILHAQSTLYGDVHYSVIYDDNIKAGLDGSTVRKHLYKLQYIHLMGILYN